MLVVVSDLDLEPNRLSLEDPGVVTVLDELDIVGVAIDALPDDNELYVPLLDEAAAVALARISAIMSKSDMGSFFLFSFEDRGVSGASGVNGDTKLADSPLYLFKSANPVPSSSSATCALERPEGIEFCRCPT